MGSIGHAIYAFDKQLFAWIRYQFGNETLDVLSAYFSNFYFWMPFLVFLFVYFIRTQTRGVALNVLYAFGTIVLSFQAAFLLSQLFAQPAPYVMELILRQVVLPASPGENYVLTTDDYSFPDWETAAITAALLFTRIRVRKAGHRFPKRMMLFVAVFAFFRVYAGHAYPYDILGGILLGGLVSLILNVFASNIDFVIGSPKQAQVDDLAELPTPMVQESSSDEG